MWLVYLTFPFTFWTRNWSHFAAHLFVVVLFVILVWATIFRKAEGSIRRFKSNLGETWEDFFSQINMHRLTSDFQFDDMTQIRFQHGAMTSFPAERCCHLVSAHAASARHIMQQRSPAARWHFCLQFLIHSTFVVVQIVSVVLHCVDAMSFARVL